MLFTVPEQRQTQIAIFLVFVSSALASAPAQRTSSASAGLFRASETPHRSVPAYSCVNSCLISCWDWFQSANSGSGIKAQAGFLTSRRRSAMSRTTRCGGLTFFIAYGVSSPITYCLNNAPLPPLLSPVFIRQRPPQLARGLFRRHEKCGRWGRCFLHFPVLLCR